jgi:ketopantoate hydroxymethyltransferase
VVIDTDEMGRPDLVQVAWRCYKEVGAEAVFVLSNERVTRRVVRELEGRGVPAFGPIWDS